VSKRKLVLANNPLLSGPKLEDRDRIGVPYREIQLDLIDPDPNQPRTTFDEEKLQELALSIKAYGVLNPILVRPAKAKGRYNLIAGERRFRASKIAGKETVPALIDQESVENTERTLAVQLVENLQRAELTTLERAHAIGTLRDTYNLSIRDIADKLSMSKSAVQRSLELLTLPDDLLSALMNGASESKVLLLSKIEDEEIRASYLKDLDVLTRNQLEKGLEKTKKDKTSAPEDQRIAEEMQRSLGLKVKIVRSTPDSQNGKVNIEFYSEGDLQEIFRKLVAEN